MWRVWIVFTLLVAVAVPALAGDTPVVAGCTLEWGLSEARFPLSCPSLYLERSSGSGETTFRFLYSGKVARERWERLLAETEGWDEPRREAYLRASGIYEDLDHSEQLARLQFRRGSLVEVVRYFNTYRSFRDVSPADRPEAIDFVESFVGLVEQATGTGSNPAIRTNRLRDRIGESLRLELVVHAGYSVTLSIGEGAKGTLRSMSIEERYTAPPELLKRLTATP